MAIQEEVKQVLDQAHQLDRQARECRKKAGELLIQAREENRGGSAWYTKIGLDQRSVELLIAMTYS